MFLYIYNDYFSLYTPGTIADIPAGRLGPLGQASAGVLVGVSRCWPSQRQTASHASQVSISLNAITVVR
jgi:hypothetical protein